MKKIIFIFITVLTLAACSDRLGGRIDQLADVPVPGKVTVTSVRSIAGGAVIKVAIPDDENLKGIVAEYERNGVVVNSKISRYVDSLTVEGFADLDFCSSHSFRLTPKRFLMTVWGGSPRCLKSLVLGTRP